MGRVTKGERSGAARLIPRARASRTSQNVKSWKVARVGPVLPERAASEDPRSTGAVGPTRAAFHWIVGPEGEKMRAIGDQPGHPFTEPSDASILWAQPFHPKAL